jgi:hypothetical protein
MLCGDYFLWKLFQYGLHRNIKRSTFFDVSFQVQHILGEMEKVQVPYESTCVWLQAQTSRFILLFTKVDFFDFGERMLQEVFG